MGVDIHFHYYPKECDNKKVLPFLDCDPGDLWINGKLGRDFYDGLRTYGEHDEESGCYIFRDKIKLFEFASKSYTPVKISDYIADPYDYSLENDDIFIIWIR